MDYVQTVVDARWCNDLIHIIHPPRQIVRQSRTSVADAGAKGTLTNISIDKDHLFIR